MKKNLIKFIEQNKYIKINIKETFKFKKKKKKKKKKNDKTDTGIDIKLNREK